MFFPQLEATVLPYLQVLSEFREGVRRIAREQKGEALPPWGFSPWGPLCVGLPWVPAGASGAGPGAGHLQPPPPPA